MYNTPAKNRTTKSRTDGPSTKRFVDPLAHFNEHRSTPRTAWQVSPVTEGEDHINIHQDSKCPLGQWFNPRSEQMFPMGEYGTFLTIEGYMYFLLANSMQVTDPAVVSRIELLRTTPSAKLTAVTSHLPYTMRRAFMHTYQLPADIYRSITQYVADAYFSKICVLAQEQKCKTIFECNLTQDILDNELPYFGYYMQDDVVVNISQRTTIISAVAILKRRLQGELDILKRQQTSPMAMALTKAGASDGRLTSPAAAERGNQKKNRTRGIQLNELSVNPEVLQQFRDNAELEIASDQPAVEDVKAVVEPTEINPAETAVAPAASDVEVLEEHHLHLTDPSDTTTA